MVEIPTLPELRAMWQEEIAPLKEMLSQILDMQNNQLVALPEAMQLSKLSKTRFYEYVKEGVITPYKEEGKTYYLRGECLTAQERRRQISKLKKVA